MTKTKKRNTRKRTTKIHMILEKRLDEIQDLLNGVVLIDEDPSILRDLQLRFIFARTLLTAEISSRQTRAHEEGDEETTKLACMAKRLTELEEAFINQTTDPDTDTGSPTETVEKPGLIGSWTEFCLSQEEEDAEEELPEEFQVYGSPEESVVKKVGFRVLVGFGIIGFVVGMASFFGYFDYCMNDNYTLTPT
ncbi:PREDICTED: uncharacterized protein LOC104798891 [Tarenaya hassleriana]|uniref:uncharacterized protein LOC104798891 n=1 Tax=Tarenaya hassleriana TaxID=28532 RepID=UPI00053C185A|nr:PREDICTED: uncharacterized protein LOC104798891 [Tarenaya hassleriana]XP_010519412.1 PREDICTED: uncharacterized protein LOC104798891 [Tarenaya hassleriana]XP_010519413.1 PREDICTED: uncharacterized protein LOC104798891 [Tarenaya hassleriana]XP_010519414.1 PREDICTED: uncharacterized protein LOC104798891 [Tarenaya hassleriana]